MNCIIKNRKLTKLLFLAATISFLFASCSVKNMQRSKPLEFPAFDAESHRGGRGAMPENTIPAMLYSLSLERITTLEMDAQITADGKVVLGHDRYLNPLTTLKPDGNEIESSELEKYPIMQMTYNDLKTFDIGSKFYKPFPNQQKMKTSIPLLENVIDSVQNYIKKEGRKQVFYNIETKSSEAGDHIFNPVPEVFVKLLMDVIEKKKIVPYVIIQSADVRTLQILKAKYPSVRTSYLVGSRRKDFTVEEDLEVLGFLPYIYSPNFKYITQDDIDKCHEMGLKVVVWTPNTKKDIEKLKSMGVDGIITDYPELL